MDANVGPVTHGRGIASLITVAIIVILVLLFMWFSSHGRMSVHLGGSTTVTASTLNSTTVLQSGSNSSIPSPPPLPS